MNKPTWFIETKAFVNFLTFQILSAAHLEIFFQRESILGVYGVQHTHR